MKLTRYRSLLLGAAFLLGLSINVNAKTFTSKDLTSIKRISETELSPDGKWVMYKVGEPDLTDNKIYNDLYAVSIDGKETIRLTNNQSSEFNPKWSPDGKKVAYVSTVNGSPQIFVQDFPKGTPKQITDAQNGVNGFKWSPDGNSFLYVAEVKFAKTTKDMYPTLDKANLRIYTSLPVRHWDEWIDENVSHLFIESVNGGNSIDIMANEPYDTPLKPFGGIEEFSWSPDSKEIAYTCKKFSGLEFVTNTNSDIYIYNIAEKNTKNITKGMPGYDKAPLYSPDGKWIAFNSQERAGFESDKIRVMLYNRQTSAITDMSKGLDQWVEEKIWAPDSKSMYFAATDSGSVHLFNVLLEGSWKTLNEELYDFGAGIHVTPDNKTLVFGVQGFVQPYEIAKMPTTGGKFTFVTTLNKDFINQFDKSNFDQRWVTAKDGKQIHCWIVYPPNFDKTKKYPVITYCQGGPQDMISPRFHYRWNMFLMASHGYIVMAPNRRGLPGFGQDWNDAISKDWGGMPMQDILSATDAFAKESFAANFVAAGASAGGYTTFWLAGNHENRFKAFLSHCGVFNLESMYGATEELWFPNWEYGGPYWEGNNMKNYDKNSPHNYAKNWNTPIIISTGEHDFRVPYTQSLEAFTVAQSKGIPSELISFPNETHFISRLQEFVIWDTEVFNFFDRFAK